MNYINKYSKKSMFLYVLVLLLTLSTASCNKETISESILESTENSMDEKPSRIVVEVPTRTSEVNKPTPRITEESQSTTTINATSAETIELTTSTSVEAIPVSEETTQIINTSESTIISEQETITEYIPDSSHYISIASCIADEYDCEVINEASWNSYRNPIMLDASLSDAVFESYCREVMADLISRGNGYRHTFYIWVNDERSNGFQTHGSGFYFYIG